MFNKFRSACFLMMLTFAAATASSQVATGAPPFGSFGGGPFDTVNLANLNVHFAIPVVNKAGRGMPFTYDLSYDSSVWYPSSSSGTLTWTPVQNWGWRGQTEAAVGYITFTSTSGVKCPISGHEIRLTNYVYHDMFGVPHNFPGVVTISCDSNSNALNATATDGSGYILNIPIDDTLSASITSRSGTVRLPPQNNPAHAGTVTDANGNQMGVNGSGVFTDTLGTTALTVSGIPPSATTFTYTSPSGSVHYSMNYSTYNLKTNFGCGGVAEYATNGISLVSSITLPDNSQYTFTYETTPGAGNSGFKTGRLASVTLPTGGTISYSYTGANDGVVCADGSTARLSRTTPDSSTSWTYSRSGSGSTWATTVTDPSTNQTVINFEKDSATTNPTANFYETQRVVKQGSGTLSTTITCYNGVNVGTPSSCYNTAVTSPIHRTTVFRYLATSTGSQAETDTTYNPNGLVSEVDEYDYGSGVVGLLLRKTLTTYGTYASGACGNLGNGIVDRPCVVKITDSGGSTKAQTTYSYDEVTPTTQTGVTQHVGITGSRGNLNTVAAQASGTTTLYRKFTYYDTGILKTSSDVSATNASTNPTTYNYSNSTASCDFAFPTSITEPMSLSRSMTWDCNGGVLLSLTDENSKISSTAYSGSNYTNKFWRPYSTTDQSGNTTNFTYPSANQTESALTFSSSVADHLTTVDSLGRLSISQTKQGPSSGNYDSVQTTYDANGRVANVTMPYVTTSGQPCSGTCPGTSYGYDTLNRITSVIDGGSGSTSSVYTNNDVLQTVGPAPTRQKQLEYDALGRLGSVCEITNGTTQYPGGTCAQMNNQTGYWTKYIYDALGDLAGVTQNAQSATTQTRTYAYDLLGRLASEGNPESGTTTYYWDAAAPSCGGGAYATPGDLGAKKDNAGVYTCYGYDALHRLAGFGSSNSTNCTGFQYDSYAPPTGVIVQNPLGRMVEAYTNSACNGHASIVTDKWFSYSPRGEVTDIYSSTPNSGGFYHLTKSYWPHGALKSLGGLPGVPTIYYGASDASGLDGEGRVTKVTASSGTSPVTAVTYGGTGQPVGSLTQVTYGSSDFDNFSYDTNTGRMTGYQFNIGTSGQAVVGTLGWNQNGTLNTLGIVDPFISANGQTCTYGYDDLARTNSVSCNNGAAWGQTFAYDFFGNITKSVPTGATGVSFLPTYSETTNHYSVLCGQLAYDNDGNLTNDCFHTYQWDANGHPIGIGEPYQTNQTFDALGNLAEQNIPSYNYTAQYLQDENGRELGYAQAQSAGWTWIPLPGGATAVYVSGNLQNYWHSDWQGSARFGSTPSRGLFSDRAFAPFGEPYASAGNTTQSYAGLLQNLLPDLFDTPNREYHPTQGRWISPDPAGLAAVDPSNPQTWNRYAYVANNPLSAIDPTGLDDCFVSTGEGSGVPCQWAGAPPPDPCPPESYLCWGPGPGSGGDPGGGGPGGGGPGGSGFSSPQHGPWPGNETTGLPQLPTQPLSLGDLLGLTPNSGFVSGVSGAGTLDSPFTIRVLVLESAGPLIECAVTPVCQEVLLAGALYVGLVATTHYMGRVQTNEWLDKAKQVAPNDPCGWLRKQLADAVDPATKLKIKQALKFGGCDTKDRRGGKP